MCPTWRGTPLDAGLGTGAFVFEASPSIDAFLQAGPVQFSRRRKLLAALSLAAVLMAAAAAAIQPALWALRFACARWRRVALLVYWVCLLMAALPLMDWVSRRRKVPTIIVRKAWTLLRPGLCLPGPLMQILVSGYP